MRRRTLLLGGATITTVSQVPVIFDLVPTAEAAAISSNSRSQIALEVRGKAAKSSLGQGFRNLDVTPTGDDTLQFSKGFLHNRALGFDRLKHERMFKAIETNDFEGVEASYQAKTPLVNPIASNTIADIGKDARQYQIASPPDFASADFAWEASEMVWAALCRDIPFSIFGSHATSLEAAKELYKSGDSDELMTSRLFRPDQQSPASPYISQFLVAPVSIGGVRQAFDRFFLKAGNDYLTNFDEFLSVYNGNKPSSAAEYEQHERLPSTPRDLCSIVYKDFPSQYFMYAAQLLLSQGKALLNRNSPYRSCRAQSAFASFGIAQCFDLLNRVACRALQVGWDYKWNVFRRARPEEYFALWQTGAPPQANDSGGLTASLQKLVEVSGAYLLPQAYPEGSPLHPAYPAGHALVSGACGTVLKCMFDENAEWPHDLHYSEDGRNRIIYEGKSTVGAEIDKLMWNISFARTFAGIHWRSDCESGIKLGEQIAVDIMNETKMFQAEKPVKFSIMSFGRTELVV